MIILKKQYILGFLIIIFLVIMSWVNILGMYSDRVIPTVAPVQKGSEENPLVGLMFNVDWGEEHLPAILDILRDQKVPATFFLTGTWAEKNPELVKRMINEGHEIGNHGGEHSHVEGMSKEELNALILQGEEKIMNACGSKPSKLFAPPYGEWTTETVQSAWEIGYKTILWTVDTVDWREPPPETIWKRALAGASPGSLILMHPTEPTREALPVIIQGLREKGLSPGTVSQVLSTKNP